MTMSSATPGDRMEHFREALAARALVRRARSEHVKRHEPVLTPHGQQLVEQALLHVGIARRAFVRRVRSLPLPTWLGRRTKMAAAVAAGALVVGLVIGGWLIPSTMLDESSTVAKPLRTKLVIEPRVVDTSPKPANEPAVVTAAAPATAWPPAAPVAPSAQQTEVVPPPAAPSYAELARRRALEEIAAEEEARPQPRSQRRAWPQRQRGGPFERFTIY